MGYHFEYLTECPPLNSNIETNLVSAIHHMELVLTDLNKSVEFQSQLQEISLVCEVEYSGSTTLRDIHIIVSNIIEYYYLN